MQLFEALNVHCKKCANSKKKIQRDIITRVYKSSNGVYGQYHQWWFNIELG